MQQYFTDRVLTVDMLFDMTSEQSFHISTVLRMKDGKTIRLVDSNQSVFLGSIQVNKNDVRVKVTGQIFEDRESSVNITLAVALIKGEHWDWMLQKATECGVTKIVPFVSAHCVVKDKPDGAQRKLQRYQKILLEAAEQSYRNRIPEIIEPIPLKMLKEHKSDMNFVAYEKEDSQFFSSISESFSSVTIVIGPEGGFNKEEVDYLLEHGFISISLGKRIYRAETAAVAACVLLDFLGERNG
jgi:16S rRNA (uracil1498-N3)-methyltransferase